MKKEIIFIFLLFVLSVSGDTSQMTVDVSNTVPSLVVSVSPNPTYDGVISIKANVTDLNGVGQIVSVNASVNSTLYNLTYIYNISTTEAYYNLSMEISEGNHTLNVSAYDGIAYGSSTTNVDNMLTVCYPSGCDYDNIQSAVDDSTDGYIVYVYNGNYSYFSIENKNNIKVIGQDKDSVIIVGDNSNSNIVIETVTNSLITNFTVYDGWHGVWLLTLVLLPVIYEWMETPRKRKTGEKKE